MILAVGYFNVELGFSNIFLQREYFCGLSALIWLFNTENSLSCSIIASPNHDRCKLLLEKMKFFWLNNVKRMKREKELYYNCMETKGCTYSLLRILLISLWLPSTWQQSWNGVQHLQRFFSECLTLMWTSWFM